MSQYNNIPLELRQLNQWVLWRLEKREGSTKPTKVPYSPWPNGGKAYTVDSPKHDVFARDTWGTFEQAISAPFTCLEPCDPELTVFQTGFTGIGFVFSEEDEYAGIDLDDTHGDEEAYARQVKVYQEFNSYSELSPSGTGLHIIIKGAIPHGRRRADIELYSKERYFTMTGNVYNNVPIAERQELLELLFDQMGGPPANYTYGQESEQRETDDEVIAKGMNAANGEKFKRLWTGDYHSLYSSQSEADFALVDILAFYTQNSAQIARLFRMSALGQRDKAQRDNYVDYMVRKSFDRQLPKVDIDGLKIQIENQIAQARLNREAAEPGGTTAPLPAESVNLPQCPKADEHGGSSVSHAPAARVNGVFPPGLLGSVAQFILDASPRPVPEIALAGAIALLSGITGRAYNISGVGLNQYILALAMTGAGKDAIAYGTAKLMSKVVHSVPAAMDFKGPGELASAPSLIKWLSKKPAIFSILGEVGVLMQQMASHNAPSHLRGLERAMLQLYSKSGHGNVFDPLAYSDADKNTAAILSPSLTLIGESVPERFYEVLDESMVMSGLLPRFMVFEYKGKREYLREGTENVQPSFQLVQSVADLAAHCLTVAHNGGVQNIPLNDEATQAFRNYERWTTDQINESKSEVMRQLWNRSHLKALKLAGVCAVGINPHNPVVTINETMWATNLITDQTQRLIAKFETGQVGSVAGSENKQLALVVRCIGEYITRPYSHFERLKVNAAMHMTGTITEGLIMKRLGSYPAFKHDKMGATVSIKRAIKMLLDADELREVPKAQMMATYGNGPKAYVVANPDRFISAMNDEV